ncbi:uracil phosphoribosyltransferase [Patescibacteria group bacterium]|nr:uracil phosphoribosyltransferase [Patescibacteria group bacterium]MBU2259513.1 uracil phosphoribosyltransferase [Patescibacteria group bacterium]
MYADLLAPLRDRSTPTAEFRKAADAIAKVLFDELKEKLKDIDEKNIITVCILRSSLVFLPSILSSFLSSPIAVVGIKRDEETAEPHCYYENIPLITKDSVLIIPDPMLATGGTAVDMVSRLLGAGAKAEHIYFLSLIAAPEGLEKLAGLIPKENITVAAVDDGLDAKKFIVPGLGDFGDRYFGYEPEVGSTIKE